MMTVAPMEADRLLRTIRETKIVHTPAGEPRQVHSHISREEGEFLQQVIWEVKPSQTLEIGLAYGISTLYLCSALRAVGATQHTVIDPHQCGLNGDRPEQFAQIAFTGWEGIGLENIARAGYGDLVTWINERSEFALPRLAAQGRSFDVVFIDGWHTFDAAILDFIYTHRLLRVGGVVAFDDLFYPAVKLVVRYAITNLGYEVLWPAEPPSFSLKQRLTRRLLGERLRADYQITDAELGIPNQNWIALRKTREIIRGDGGNQTQRWDEFHSF